MITNETKLGRRTHENRVRSEVKRNSIPKIKWLLHHHSSMSQEGGGSPGNETQDSLSYQGDRQTHTLDLQS